MSLRIAIQKSGRLTDSSYTLIAECGIEVERANGKLKIPAYNFPMELMSLRDDDIPKYVADGVVDAGIVGENTIQESGVEVTVIRKLGFGRCRLSLAVPKDFSYTTVQDFSNKRIATSYPLILSRYLKDNGVKALIHEISGSAEIAPGMGLSEAIFDVVSSGSTLQSNGLQEVETVLKSEAVLIVSPKIEKDAEEILCQLDFRIAAVLRARHTKYITLNAPRDRVPAIVSLLPGLKSPSLVPHADDSWVSLHTVVDEDNFWGIIEKLKEAGASGILVMPIEKVVA